MKSRSKRLHFLSLLLLTTSLCHADDWPQWLGPNREPVWHETGIVEEFPKDGPPLRWKTDIGSGYSGPAVSNGRVFVMDRTAKTDLDDGEALHQGKPPKNLNFLRRKLPGSERVVCLNESDGKILWTREYDCPYTTVALYAIGPRCTPTVDGDLVYTLGAEGRLMCMRAIDGVTVWERDFKDDYGLEVPEWGCSSHPLVDGDQLICVVGGDGTTCVSFDKRTGKELWRALSSQQPGYCPPVIYDIDDERHLIIWHGDAIEGLNPKTGDVYWSVPFQATYGMAVGAPQLSDHTLYIMCFARQSAAIQIADDRRSAEIIWRGDTKHGIPGVLNTAILNNGHIYACGDSGRYSCAKLETGEKLWSTFDMSADKRRSSWGNVFTIRNGDRYIHANDLGDLIIARMTPDKFTEISRTHLIDPTHNAGGRTLVWSHPAFANRNIYLRNDKEIRCYSLRKPTTAVKLEWNLDSGNGLFTEGPVHFDASIKSHLPSPFDATMKWRVEDDEGTRLSTSQSEISVAANSTAPTRFTFKVSKAGFYKVIGTLQSDDSSAPAIETTVSKFIGYVPEQIKVPLTREADFDQFWNTTLKTLADVEPQFELERKPDRDSKTHDVYEVTMRSLDNVRVRGWYEHPKNIENVPALLRVPGYSQNMQPTGSASPIAYFSFNVRGHGNSKDDSSGKDDYWIRGLDDKNGYYYQGAYADCVRAVDFLMTRTEIDKSRVGVTGGSQGGGLSWATAALDQRISLCAPDIPFLCDWVKYFKASHWPEMDDWIAEKPERTWASTLKTMSYFDTLNMADRIKCPVFISLGVQDDICPPATIFSVYNRLPGERQFHAYPNAGHWAPGSHQALKKAWIASKFKSMTTGRAGSLRKAPKRGHVGGVN